MSPDSFDRTRAILDSVHGLIRLTPEEVEIIDHPLFQRLRGIKQNGLLHMIFPAATHTRFEHSIGTVFVASSMLDAITYNSSVGASKTPPRVVPFKEAKPGQAVNSAEMDPDDRRVIYRITRLAALAHDLGHGPLSHTFDAFAPTPDVVRTWLQDPQVKTLRTLESAFAALANRHGKIKHEAMSCIFFAAIWGDRDPEMLVAVCAAILGPLVSSSVTPKLRPWVILAHDLIASAPADADRMDYLERDSRSLGVTYGLFDRNRVLKTLLCYLETSHGEVRYRLGLKKSGMRAIENLIQARFEMYAQIYNHKTNRAATMMLDAIAEDGKQQQTDFWPDKSFPGIRDRYLELSDEHFLRVLCGGPPQVVPDSIKERAKQVASRELWKRIVDCEYNKTPSETVAEAEKQKAKLQDQFPGEPLAVDLAVSDATKDLDNGARLLARQSGGVYEYDESGTWQQASPIIQTLSDRDLAIVRVFLCKHDEALASRMRFQDAG